MGEVFPLIDEADSAAESDWTERALCAETDPEAFFPEKGGSTREAKKVCRGCDVRSERALGARATPPEEERGLGACPPRGLP